MSSAESGPRFPPLLVIVGVPSTWTPLTMVDLREAIKDSLNRGLPIIIPADAKIVIYQLVDGKWEPLGA